MATKTLKCEECGTCIGELVNGALVIKTRHHGQEHTTTFSLATLMALAYCDGPGKVTISAEPTNSKERGEFFS